jgi:hypothetical protein
MGEGFAFARRPLQRADCGEGLWQGLKPGIDLMGFIGLTEVMPLLQSL